jgi:RNA polymerase sigma-70 factor (ECF subfamily)
VREFKAAWTAQDIGALIGLLDPDAVATADGGGLVAAHVQPIVGGPQIAHAYAELARVVGGRATFVECTVNGLPGLAARLEGRTATVFAFEVAEGRIRHIWAVANPEKIRPWASLSPPAPEPQR